jgi:hypothetical protein
MQAWNQLLDTLRTTGASVRLGARSIGAVRLRVVVEVEVEVEVLADLVEYSGDDLLLDRLCIGRIDVLVRALLAVRDAFFDGSTQNGAWALLTAKSLT